MDYLLADTGVIPQDTTQSFSEQVYRLPGSYLCYVAPDYAPSVVEPPNHINGLITFGCFNNLSKVTGTMIAIWSQILNQVPDARLVLKAKQLADPVVKQRIRDSFIDQGIASERVILDGEYIDHIGLLGYYGKLDIALDTYPYSGVTTSCEALWMGVPVVTLAGRTFISRNTASLLGNVGLNDLIAESPERYIEKAVMLAHDRDRLKSLRRNLRKDFQLSSLGDGSVFTQNLEVAYRDMWGKWCKTTN